MSYLELISNVIIRHFSSSHIDFSRTSNTRKVANNGNNGIGNNWTYFWSKEKGH